MAKVIQSKFARREKMLQLISYREILQIYCQSVIIVFYIGLINFYKMIKSYFDKRVRREITRQFSMLSVSQESESQRKNNNNNNSSQSISPLTLTSRYGAHKYIKIKVINWLRSCSCKLNWIDNFIDYTISLRWEWIIEFTNNFTPSWFPWLLFRLA